MIRIYNTRSPRSLFHRLDGQAFNTHRPLYKRFFTVNRIRVGLQVLPNKVAPISRKLNFDWHFTLHSPDSIRNNLKGNLFKYPSSAVSFSVPECIQIERRLLNLMKIARHQRLRRQKEVSMTPDGADKDDRKKP